MYQFTRLFTEIRVLGDVLACGKRLVEVNQSTINSEENEFRNNTITDSRDEAIHNLDYSISLEKLCLKKPGYTSVFIFNNLSFNLPIGKSLLIEGENGVGKTSLLRLLAGLWKSDSGTLNINSGQKTMFIQETPVLNDGTLLQQLVYPNTADDAINLCDNTYVDILTKVGLSNLKDELLSKRQWSNILSLGEKQKISFARVLLCRPDLVFLDESSSSLSLSSEKELYTLLKRENIQTVTISHRTLNIIEYHDYILNIQSDFNHSFKPI